MKVEWPPINSILLTFVVLTVAVAIGMYRNMNAGQSGEQLDSHTSVSGSSSNQAGGPWSVQRILASVSNTFLHVPQFMQLRRSDSAPGRMECCPFQTSPSPRPPLPSQGSAGHDEGQCGGACRHHRAGHCNRGHTCSDCHIDGCTALRQKKGKQHRDRERGEGYE